MINYGLYDEVAQSVIGIYARASTCLALIKIHSIINKLKRKYEKQIHLQRSNTLTNKRKEFDDEIDNLFEVLVCQCPMWKNDEDAVEIDCSCPLNDKIPSAELEFVYAQRFCKSDSPALQIGRVDIPTTKKLKKNEEKKVYYTIH